MSQKRRPTPDQVCNLPRAELDYWTAVAIGAGRPHIKDGACQLIGRDRFWTFENPINWTPSTDWHDTGMVIDRWPMMIDPLPKGSDLVIIPDGSDGFVFPEKTDIQPAICRAVVHAWVQKQSCCEACGQPVEP